MEQLTQQLKTGDLAVQDLPWPQVQPGMILVRNHYSLISAGTEGSTVKTAQKSLIGKAKERPEQARQVLDALRRQGVTQTYRAVMKRLDAYSPMGYSSAGEVIEIGRDVTGFRIGDRVAGAGVGYANHAELVCVPRNLCVKLPADADLKSASYNTMGAIALQGIRQSELRLGESCAVIGLGLLGQLTCLMLRAGGVKTFGIDIDDWAVAKAVDHCCDAAWCRSIAGIASRMRTLTDGMGVDAVIITAATSSLDPINFAGEIVRRRGRVVVVGAVPTGFNREQYYKKELELRMSCSYGPGRYDPDYEENGNDYPPAYVRWTENRNMQAFQEFVHSGRVDVGYLTTHQFALADAPRAYDMIVNRTEPFLGVVLAYDCEKPIVRRAIRLGTKHTSRQVVIGFIGAGSYAQQNLLPNIPRDGSIGRAAIVTRSSTTSKRVAERFGFGFCTSDPDEVFDDGAINTIFVATRHDSHADYVKSALGAGKHVFVEKPVCVTLGALNEIEALYYGVEPSVHLMVGFNRRYAPSVLQAKTHFGQMPVSMLYRVNAGSIPENSWVQDRTIGGGRIVGEVCHFLDLLTFFADALPTRVHATALPDPKGLDDTVSINVTFADGSIGTICYFANGSKAVPKEYIEIYGAGMTAVIKDFRGCEIYGEGSPRRRRSRGQDKGQAHMVRAFLDRIRTGGPPLIPPEQIFAVTRATFAVCESLRSSQAVVL